jgi:hypothetical protein
MVVNGAGDVEGVFVTPTSLQACVEPVLRPAKLPATRSGRQRVTYEIKAANAETTPSTPSAPDEPAKPEPAVKKKKPTAKR